MQKSFWGVRSNHLALEIAQQQFVLTGNSSKEKAYLIFVTNTTSSAGGEKSVMWRNFPHNKLSCDENLHMAYCHVENISIW